MRKPKALMELAAIFSLLLAWKEAYLMQAPMKASILRDFKFDASSGSTMIS